jgi:SAM-dependent methyltransferase
MPLSMRAPEHVPCDTARLPEPGSPQQAELIADEEQIAADSYLETIRAIDSSAEMVFPEVARHVDAALSIAGRRRGLRVLDLGCGIALEMHAILKCDVTVDVLTLSDYSAKTLEIADRLLGDQPTRSKVKTVELVPLDLLAAPLSSVFSGGYDLIVTCNSFMHFPERDHVRLFSEIAGQLRDGGVFLFQSHFKTLEPTWKESIIHNMQTRMKAQGAKPELIAQAGTHINRFHQFHDYYRVYNWLEMAGFRFFDGVFRQRFLGAFVAFK